MANDGVHEVRIGVLERQMSEVLEAIHELHDEMRKECATKAELRPLEARLQALETKLDALAAELKALQIECAQRFAAIENQLTHFATKDDLRQMGLRIMLANFTMHLAVVAMLLHYLR